MKFEGEYLYDIKNGKGIEYNDEGKLIFKGEYLNDNEWKGKKYEYEYDSENNCDVLEGEYEYLFGDKNGKAIKYFKDGKIRFKGEYLNGEKWNGKEYNPYGELVNEIKNGKGNGKEFNFYGDERVKTNLFSIFY